jgi:hypothetical protein
VNTIQVTLGQVLLLLVGLAVVLFILILLLVEAHYIVRLSKQLGYRFRSIDPESDGSTPAAVRGGSSDVSRDEQEVS